MKFLLSLIVLAGSTTTFARQYTQCSAKSPELYSVINLPAKEEGSIYLTLGAETGVASLSKIVLKEQTAEKLVYDVFGKTFTGVLEMPANVMGLSSDYIEAKLVEGDATYNFTCFTRHYVE